MTVFPENIPYRANVFSHTPSYNLYIVLAREAVTTVKTVTKIGLSFMFNAKKGDFA